MTDQHTRSWARGRLPIAAWVGVAVLAAHLPGWAAGLSGEATRSEGSAASTAADPREATAAPAGSTGIGAPAETAAKSDAAPGARRAPMIYVPPSRGRARHTAGAGTRGHAPASGVASAPGASRPRVRVLAPVDHVGLTTSASPTLYWDLSAPTTTPIELTVVDDDAIEPLVKLSLPGPIKAGLHALELEALGVELARGKTYRWFVALVHDAHRRSKDELAEGAIERIDPPAALEAPVPGDSLRSASLRYAEQGVWYDALAAIARAIEQEPGNASLAADRAALLDQVSGVGPQR